MAHHTELPYLEVFEYLLSKGADASLVSKAGPPRPDLVSLHINFICSHALYIHLYTRLGVLQTPCMFGQTCA